MTSPTTSSITAAPENDLALGLLQAIEIRQHAGRNADARRREGRPDHDGDEVVEPEQPTDAVAERERQRDADDRDRRRRAADLQQLAQVGFQTDFEQQNDDAESRASRVQHVVPRIDQARDRQPEQHAGRSSPSTAGWPIATAAAPHILAATRMTTNKPRNCGTSR